MASEITVTQQISIVNGNLKIPNASGGKLGSSLLSIDQATALATQPTISAITTGQGTLIDLSALSPAIPAGGMIFFQNLDPTNYVTWGVDNGAGNIVKVGYMKPGEYAGPFRGDLSQQKFRFLANTAACNVATLFAAP